jgi:phosphatidylglycerol:prolipoprotein diacylglycerol transferase
LTARGLKKLSRVRRVNNITITINPIIWQWGNLQLTWHAVAMLLAIIVAVVVAAKSAHKQGISASEIYYLAPWVMLLGFIGARLFHVFDHWGYYMSNPLQILAVQEGGLAIWGAVIGGAIAVIAYTRLKRLSLSLLFDTLTPALLVGQIIGRVGCTINGDAWGGPTNLPWGFTYLNPNDSIPTNLIGVPTHPYPVYEMIWNGLCLILLLKLRPHFKTGGLMFFSYLALYSLGRFVLTFVRQETIVFWGLQEAQVVAVIGLIASMLGFIYLLIKEVKRGQLTTI